MGLSMNHLDWVVLAVLAVSFFLGYRRGFLTQLISFLSLFVAWIAAYTFYDRLAPWVAKVVPVSSWADYTGYGGLLKGTRVETYIVNTISFSLILLGIKIGLSAAGHVLNILVKVPGLNGLNRWTGAFLALVEAAAVAAVVLQILALLPYDGIQSLLAGSEAARYTMEWLMPAILGKIKELPSSVI